MKAILEFSLPEEKTEFILAQNGGKYYATISDIEDYFRKNLKYNSDNFSDKELEFLEKIRNDVYDIIKEREVEDI